MNSDVMKAFLEQSGIDPESIEQSHIYHEMFDEQGGNRSGKAADSLTRAKLFASMDTGFDLMRHVRVPSQVKQGSLDEQPTPHPQMASYNHSLEVDRWEMVGGQGGGDPIEI